MSKYMVYQIDKWRLGSLSSLVDIIDSRYMTMEKCELVIHCMHWMRSVFSEKVCDQIVALAMTNDGFPSLMKQVFAWMLDEKEKKGAKTYTTGRLTIECDPFVDSSTSGW